MQESAADTAVPADGRAARALRTREAIVDACIALVEEGDLRPTAPRIAARAGVSVRSVFQHFADLPSLHIAVTERIAERMAALVVPIDPGLPLDARIGRFVAQRANLLEAMTPFRVAANVHGPFAPEIRQAVHAGSALLRAEVERVFAPELATSSAADRGEVTDALATVSSWGTWDSLRTEWNDDPDRARAVLARLVRAVLTPAAST
ncbi:MAG TPA: TetR/AcrR family transcriptional regulator [Acidimicrobiales bacterium]|nr:TetR/AcrR family transcriptional regulator [Acidimicrobiales bacterium]